ncbi:hypothetical protein D9M69_705050 [compost metagenome]
MASTASWTQLLAHWLVDSGLPPEAAVLIAVFTLVGAPVLLSAVLVGVLEARITRRKGLGRVLGSCATRWV